jgi:hypothetical protein
MRAALVRPRQNHNSDSGLSVGAIVGISLAAAVVVALAATAVYMFSQRFRRNKAMKRQSAKDEIIAMSTAPPPALNTQFAGRTYRPNRSRNVPSQPPTLPPLPPLPSQDPPPRAPSQTSPRDPEEARIWAEWLVQTAPKEPRPVAQADVHRRPQLSTTSPWLEAEPSALPEGRGSRITNVGSEDMRSPIELELAQDAQLENAQGHVRATSGPLPGPSAIPASPPLGSRTSLHPPPRMISIKRKPIVREASVSGPPAPSSPTTVSPPSVSPKSSISNPPSSRRPSLPYPDFNVPTSPDELFIPHTTPLGPILELSSPVRSIPGDPYSPAPSVLRAEDVPVLLARERVEMLREERERLERIQELKKLEEQAQRDLREAQRTSLEAKRRSAEAQRSASRQT